MSTHYARYPLATGVAVLAHGVAAIFVSVVLAACGGGGGGGVSGSTPVNAVGVVSLPKTGQISCFDPGGATTTISCPGTGQDGDNPTGVDWPAARFVVGSGVASDCVTDKLTGLMWTKDGNLPAITHPGPQDGKRTWPTALDYAQTLNSNSYCGFADWRLPNVYELESLVDSEALNQADNLNAKGFTHVQGSGPHDASGYWTSTTIEGLTDSAWGVDMHNGCAGACHVKTDAANYVWPVRTDTSTVAAVSLSKTGQIRCYGPAGAVLTSCDNTGQDGELQVGATGPSARFVTDPGGQCVTDNLTGLTWAQDANAAGRQTWQQALGYANSLVLCGFDDWRLPNRKEMLSLMNIAEADQVTWLTAQGFGNVDAAYWTSTTVAGTEYAWFANTNFGTIERSLKASPDCATWPVRGGR